MSLYSYADPKVRRLVKLLKYRSARRAAGIFGPPLAALLTEFLGEEARFLGSGKVLLVPVPLSKGRRSARGYNQAELLAKAVLRHLSPDARAVLDAGLLEKRFDTVPQADIPRRPDRLRNLGDCFAVRKGRACRGEVVVLVDDVTTTGATLLAARRALLRAGFSRVFALTVAH